MLGTKRIRGQENNGNKNGKLIQGKKTIGGCSPLRESIYEKKRLELEKNFGIEAAEKQGEIQWKKT